MFLQLTIYYLFTDIISPSFSSYLEGQKLSNLLYTRAQLVAYSKILSPIQGVWPLEYISW
jgi:hypothetical protein